MNIEFQIVKLFDHHNRGQFIVAKQLDFKESLVINEGSLLNGIPIYHYLEMYPFSPDEDPQNDIYVFRPIAVRGYPKGFFSEGQIVSLELASKIGKPRNIPVVGQRIASMFVDHFAMTGIICIPGIIISVLVDLFSGPTISTEGKLFGVGSIGVIIILLFSLYFNKDILNGQSIGKRLLKLQVIDNVTKTVASPLKCLLRNITIIIWPVEVIVVLFTPARRLGDRIANTSVLLYDPLLPKEPLNRREIIKALIIGFILLGVTLLIVSLYNGDN